MPLATMTTISTAMVATPEVCSVLSGDFFLEGVWEHGPLGGNTDPYPGLPPRPSVCCVIKPYQISL